MPIYRGDGGSGDATTDAYASQVALDAQKAEDQANIATTKASEASNSAAAALSSENNASTSEDNALDYKNDAQKLAINAEDSQYTLSDGVTTGFSALHHKEKAIDAQAAAETAESNAQGHETAASGYATTASGHADTATTQAGIATTQAGIATTQAGIATTQAGIATTKASEASDDADDAEKLAINPEDSQFTLSDGVTTGYSALHYNEKAQDAKTAAETAQAAAEAAQDAIDGLYLGAQTSNPTVDLNGDPVTAGDWYFNTTSNSAVVYDGSAWNTITSYELSTDTTPQLGGDLDFNGNIATSFESTGIDDNATSTAITIDSSQDVTFTSDAKFPDTGKALFGAGPDLEIRHDATNSVIDNYTGNLILRNYANDQDITLQSDNGTGGLTVYFRADGSTGGARLYHYGSEKIATTSSGVEVTGAIDVDGVMQSTGEIRSGTNVIAGRQALGANGGEVALTINDGQGNANVTFNHTSGVPDQNGNSARIVVNTDTTSNASMLFELASGVTGGTSVNTTQIFRIDEQGVEVTGETHTDTLDVRKDVASTVIATMENADVTASHVLKLTAGGAGTGTKILECIGGAGDPFQVLGNGDVNIGGRVGIGTDSPTSGAKLDVEGSIFSTGATPQLSLNDSGGGIHRFAAANNSLFIEADNEDTGGAMRLYVGGSERMRIDSNGNVGIGTGSNIDTRFHVERTDNDNSVALFETNNNTCDITLKSGARQTRLRVESNAALVVRDDTVAQERMRIDSSGNLLVGKSSISSNAGHTLYKTGVHYLHQDGTGASDTIRLYRNGGTFLAGWIRTSGTGATYNSGSDLRLKDNITDAPAGNIDNIRVRSFDWKLTGEHQTYGMIAQELVEVAPEAVSQGETEDDMWGVDYSKLVPMMIKEIQDLKAEVAALKGAN